MIHLYAKCKTQCKTLLTLAVGFFAAVGVLSMTQGHPAQASISPGVNLAALVARLNADEATIATLKANTAALHQTGTPGSPDGLLQIQGVNVQIVSGSGYTE